MEYPRLLVVIKSPKGSISNKSEVEQTLKAAGLTTLFIEYETGSGFTPEISGHPFYQPESIQPVLPESEAK